MNVEAFIARRYFTSGRYFTAVSTWITIAGVTLGVAVVCFVMAMHNGFETEIRSRLLGTTSHISIFPTVNEVIEHYREIVDSVAAVPGVVAASPFIYAKAAIASASQGDGIVVRGIDPALEQLTSTITTDIKVGQYSFDTSVVDGDTVSGIILGSGLASRLGVFIGQPVLLYSISGETIRQNIRPRVAKFHVSGIFETGMYEFDASLAYISLADAQKLFRMGDVVTAVHLKLEDIYHAEALRAQIDSLLGFQYDVVPWYQLHRNIFSAIEWEKLLLFLGFTLIVLVAAFSIIATLVMTTMQKRPEIGILKTMGSTPHAIRTIFVYKGMFIGLVGVLSGWGLALLAAWIQNRFHLVSLPADIYFISYLPIEPHLPDFLATGLLTGLICFLAALYPAWQAARLPVVEVLRQ
jgi:lipoprotein-releasing system permease protein